MKQPDFKEIFSNYFGTSPKKIYYQLRNDSNRRHDLVFVDSLIHDARFRPDKIKIDRNKVLFFIERDCWELGIQNRINYSGLYITKSELLLSPVYNIEFKTTNVLNVNSKDELWIKDIELIHDGYGNSDEIKINLTGFDWNIVMKSKSSRLILSLKDLKVPYLLPLKTKKK